MFYIVCAIASLVGFFISTSAFILGGPVVGVCVSLIVALACVYWLGEAYEVWCEQ